MEEPPGIQCDTCFTKFKIEKCLKQHKCSISTCSPSDKHDMEVKDDVETKRMLDAFLKQKNSPHQLLRFSYITGTALPGLVPLFFHSKHTPPILSLLGSYPEDGYNLLRAAAEEAPVKIWKTLKIRTGDKLLKLTQNLIPTSKYELRKNKLKLVDKQDHVMVYHMGDLLQVRIFHTFSGSV